MQRRAFLQSLGAGVLGLGTAGCVGQFSERGLSDTVTVGYPSPALPVYNFALFPAMAEELAAEGAQLELKQFKGYTPMVSAIMRGDVSMGVLSLTSLLRARAQDFPVVSPVGYTREYAFAMVTTPGVEGWEDLRGETIALHSPSSISTATGRAMVADRLGSVDAAPYEYIVGTPSRLAAIEAGEVAAAVVFVSGALQAEREGYASALAYPWEFARLRDQTTAALVVPESAIEGRPATVERLVEAAEAAYDRLYEADATAITEAALATDRFAEFDPAVWVTAFERVRKAEIWPRDGGLDAAAIRRAEELLVDTGMIAADKRLPPAAFVAEGFR